MAKDNSHWKEVKLSARVFGHISQGLYRTSAGAIKELISNAFDADAPLVRIHTGFPRFEIFSCEDTGTGLTQKEFERLMERGIGISEKRLEEDARTPDKKRLIIGRLGIGLLSLAQICTEFDLISHHVPTKKAFKATLRFPPYTREEVDKADSKEGFVKGGEYLTEEIPFNSAEAGVKVLTRNLRDAYVRRMRDLNRYRKFVIEESKSPYENFEEYVKYIFYKDDLPKALREISDYDQLIFGLSLIPPLTYMDSGSNFLLNLDFLKEYQERLSKNDFKLFVDNMELHRPVRLPSERNQRLATECKVKKSIPVQFSLEDGSHSEQVECIKHTIDVEGADENFAGYELKYEAKKVGGRPMKFMGYLFQQTSRIFPRELQGILVRIRDVAIGPYDNSLMVYPTAEGPRYSMVSGELIVEEGFEDALNIDRDSFNMLHPHYLRMQAYLHALLNKTVFPQAWTEEKNRNKQRREVQVKQRSKDFADLFMKNFDNKYSHIAERTVENAEEKNPVEFNHKRGMVFVNINHPLLQTALKRKKYSEMIEQIAVAFEAAMRTSNVEQSREIFYGLLADIFKIQP